MDELGIAAATAPLVAEDPTLPSVLADTKAVLQPAQPDEELYAKWKRLEGHEEFLDLQEVRPALPAARRGERSEGSSLAAATAARPTVDRRSSLAPAVAAALQSS